VNRQERIGIFGGTFDPIHKAHLEIARAAMAEAHLDRVLFVVAGRPPHKQDSPLTASEHRYAMVEAALAEEPHMEPNSVELEREGPSYTADTLRTLRKQFPEAALFLIIGMDSLVDLPGWREPDVILDLARLLVAPRPGEWRIPPGVEGHYDTFSFNETTLSSTEVRALIAEGHSLGGVLPDAVAEYLEKHPIYGTDTSHT
jgi:nicotinate-nucleotide adenylyltransferase